MKRVGQKKRMKTIHVNPNDLIEQEEVKSQSVIIQFRD